MESRTHLIVTRVAHCLVCNDPVQVAADLPEDEPVLCIVHWFTEDMSEEWEADEEGQE